MPKPGGANVRRNLDRLRALALSPARQVEFATKLVADERNSEVLEAAANVLAQSPQREAHDAIAGAIADLMADGRRRDPGGFARAALMRALQPLVVPGDLPLLESAAIAFEPTPQSASAPATLRAAALVAMLDVDPGVAAYHAAAHLSDADRMSGEPAVTAVRVLAAAGNEVALVQYILAGKRPELFGGDEPEVLAECLRQLREVPPGVLQSVVARAMRDTREVVQLGLCDLFVHHRAEPLLLGAARRFLRETRDLELYHYLAASIVAERREDLLEVLSATAAEESEPAKLRILEEALTVRESDPAVAQVLALVRRRREPERRN